MSFIPWGPDFFGGSAGSLNLQFNQGYEDLRARSYFWQVPDSNFGLSIYSGLGNSAIDVLCDPRYTLGQAAFANNNSIFPGLNTGMNMLSNPFFNNGLAGAGAGAGSGASGSGSSSKAKTREEREMENENNKILNLLEKLNKSRSFSCDELSDSLKEIKKIKSISDKNEALKDLYKEYQADVKSFLTSHEAKEFKGGISNLDKTLDAIGYERGDSPIDSSDIDELEDAIKKLNKEHPEYLGDSNIATNLSQYEILDVLSSYNTKHGNLAEILNKRYNENSLGDDSKDKLKSFAGKLRSQLAVKAEAELAQVDDASIKSSLQDKVKELNKLSLGDSGFVNKFNEVYAITRVLAARNLGNKLAASYESIDNETFNESMFLDSTKTDLASEGLDSSVNSVISTAESAKLKKKAAHKATYSGSTVKDTDKIEKQIEALKENTVDELSETVSIDDEDYTVYEEKEGTGANGVKKQYIVKEDEDGKKGFYEITKDSEGNVTVAENPTKATEIKKAVDKKRKEIKAAEEQRQKELEDEIKKQEEADLKAVEAVLGTGNAEKTSETKTDQFGNTVTIYKDKRTGKKYILDIDGKTVLEV